MKISDHGTAQEAWEWINEYLATQEKEIVANGGTTYGAVMISYDHYMTINRIWVDPEFDFGYMFGYRIQKWSKLISNYVDLNSLDLVKSQVVVAEAKKKNNYNISMKFQNAHDSGKGCLLALTFSRRITRDNPILILHTRSSEVTKRLLFDFLLMQRIAEYVYGNKVSASLVWYCPNVYLSGEAFSMYNNHRDIEQLMKDYEAEGIFKDRILEIVKKFKTVDPKTVTYKVNLRAVKRLQGIDSKHLYAKDCIIYKNKELPEEIISPSQKRTYNRRRRRKIEE